MEIFEGDALNRMIFQRYSQNPRGWSFSVSRSPQDGFFDAFVGGPEASWHLKLDTIFKPSPFVLGAQTELAQPALDSKPLSFGFRRIEPSQATDLQPDSPDAMRRLFALLGSTDPVVPSSPGSYVQGPSCSPTRGCGPAR